MPIKRSSWRSRGPVVLLMPGVVGCSLVGCALVGPDDPEPTAVPWSQVQLPDDLTDASERTAITTALPAAGGRPQLLLGVQSQPGGQRRVSAWTSDDDRTWTIRDLLPDELEPAEVVAAATSAEGETWVAGWSWSPDGGTQPLLLRSPDRVRWESAVLDADVLPSVLALIGPTQEPLLLGVDAQHLPVVVRGVDGSSVRLPPPPDGTELRGFGGVAVRDDLVVATAAVARPGEPDESAVYRSTDGGDTWTVAPSTPAPAADTAGVVVADGAFVATGAVRGADGVLTGAAWSTQDGLTWTADALGVPDGSPEVPVEGEQWSLGVPVVAPGGGVAAAAATETGLRSSVLRRDGGGAWTPFGYTDPASDHSVPTRLAAREDGSVLTLRSSMGASVVQVVSADGQRGARTAFGRTDGAPAWASASVGTSPVRLEALRRVVTTRGEGAWSQDLRSTTVSWDGTTLAAAAADPPETASLSNVRRLGTPEGTTVVMGDWFEPNHLQDADPGGVRGWAQTAPGAWTPMTGLDGPALEGLASVRRTPVGWVAVGHRSDSDVVDRVTGAVVWSSTDGVSWAEDPAPLTVPGSTDTSADDVCVLADGTLVVVGTGVRSDGSSEPVAWHRAGADWAAVTGPAFGATDGWTSSCVSAGGSLVVEGERDGRSTLWRTADGLTFDVVLSSDRGERVREPQVLGDGFAAAGDVEIDGVSSAALWVSQDGTRWSPVVVPSQSPTYGSLLVVDEQQDSVLVATSSDDGVQLWRVDGAAALLAEPPPRP